uniref:Uncharacterized protein n=3 Tax=Cacopsylla melanoneura TaxID=428564 RepID=A0A8D8VWZ4_9HEMI
MEDDKRSVTSSRSAPPIPLQTYIWEDIRRQKIRGLYPWTHLYKGPFTGSLDIELDHDYEPITPMSTNRPSTPPPILKVSTSATPDATNSKEKPNDAAPASGSKEKQYLKLPADEDIVTGDADEEYEEEEEEYDEEEVEEEEMSDDQGEFEDDDEEMTAEELQAQMEERFFNQANTPARSAIPVKSKPEPGASGVKTTPSALKQGSPQPQTQSFQQKLKTQADKIKASFQTMSKRKEASNEGTEGNDNEGEPPAKSRFQLNKPRFDRSKFKLPDRPKLKMPDRAKFKMPARPKFKMPERPKFNLPDRSKFKLPDRPKINLPNIKLPKRSNSFKEEGTVAGTSTMGSKKNLFDFHKTMTYPRIFNKRKREENGQTETPEHKTESIPTTSSAPSTPLWKRANLGQKWDRMITELKSRDFHKKMKPNDESSATASQPSPGTRQRSIPGNESLDDSERNKTRSASSGLDTDKEQHSSGASSLRDRKGVLEEINSDEFFLREKGLSRDNVEVSRFLTREIRDAFKADAEKEESEFEDEEEEVPEPEELPQKQTAPPQRSKSFNRFISTTLGRFHKKDKKELEEKKEQYQTYPPRKAERKKRDSVLFVVIPLKDENDPEFAPSIPVNDHTDEDYEVQRQVFKAVAKPKQDNLQVPEPEKRARTPEDNKEQVKPSPENKENVAPIQCVVQAQIEDFPSAPRRKRSLTQSLRNEGILKDVDNNKDNKSLRSVHSIMDPEPGLHQYPTPVAPRRRSRSLGTSLTSEDRTSRGADSMPSEEQEETVGYAIVEKSNHEPPATPPRSKPPRPPPPCRRRRTFNMIRDQGLTNFFTFPRRKSYVEEIPIIEKSYSTVGPTRPPRRSSRSKAPKEPVYADGSIHSDIGYIDNESDTKSIDQRIQDFAEDFIKMEYGGSIEDKDLQSDEVKEKMKGRPLPAPPRPPRKTKQDGEDSDIEDIEQDAKLSGTTPPIDNIAVNLHTDDTSIAIQTDPLTDEYIVTNTDTIDRANSTEKTPTRVIPQKGERKSLNQEKKVNEESKQNDQLNNLEYPTLPLRRDRRSLSKDEIKKDTKILNTSPNETCLAPQQSFIPIDEFCRQQTAANFTSAMQAARPSNNQPGSPRPTPRREPSPPPKPPSRQKGDNNDNSKPFTENEVTFLKAHKLQIEELDVNRIHVNELQASRITVHDMDSDTINVSRINSTSGNLVIDNIELPSDILQSLSQSITGAISFSSATLPNVRSQVPSNETDTVKQDQSSQVSPTQQSIQSQTQSTPSSHESTQTKPQSNDTPTEPEKHRSSPDPDYSVPVPKYYRTRKYSYDSEDVMIVPIPVPRVRRRHHHTTDPTPSTSNRDEDQDSALDLGRRFVNVVTSDIMSLIQTFMNQLPRGEKQQQRDVVQMFICIFITIFALFFLVGYGSGNKTIHTHHWDYQFPPPPP